jgi:aspartate racemase
VKKVLGILGGMGPLAGADFLAKLTAATPASCDQEHIPVILYSVPQIPDRTAAILRGGASPLPAMLEGVRALKDAGAILIAIPCNTAHYWYDELASQGELPILHIADAVIRALDRQAVGNTAIGLMGTRGTLAAGFYQQRFAKLGLNCIENLPEEHDTLVAAAIAEVKANRLDSAVKLASAAAQKLFDRGATRVVLGCTELPLAIDLAEPELRARCLDATQTLATACVDWWSARGQAI